MGRTIQQGQSNGASNNTVGTLRMILDIGIEFGACYDNPAKTISKHRVRQKQLELPSQAQFMQLVNFVESVRVGRAKSCANLMRFLAFGGFRKSEAKRVTWADCDFEKGEITVRGDADTGTKNWSIRRVPMIPEMKALLEKLRNEHPDAKPTDPVMIVAECQGAINTACRQLESPVLRITTCDIYLQPVALSRAWTFQRFLNGLGIRTVEHWQ